MMSYDRQVLEVVKHSIILWRYNQIHLCNIIAQVAAVLHPLVWVDTLTHR